MIWLTGKLSTSAQEYSKSCVMKKENIISDTMDTSENGNYNMIRMSPWKKEGCKKGYKYVTKKTGP